MEKKFKLGVIGAGFMSNAIINGILNAKTLSASEIIVSDINEVALDNLAKKGIATTKNNSEVFSSSTYLLLAIKPQTFISLNDDNADKVEKVISIMAGVNKAKIRNTFKNAKVVRCMPNTPVSVGFGAIGIDASEFTDNSDINFINSIFSSVAKIVFVSEDKLSAVTGISGSSPAYFYLFAKSLIDAGVKSGLSETEAESLVLSTMKGSVLMMEKRGDKTLNDLITAVCSKGGTTIEAMKVFEDKNLPLITEKAVNACINRAKELEKL